MQTARPETAGGNTGQQVGKKGKRASQHLQRHVIVVGVVVPLFRLMLACPFVESVADP